MSYRVVADTNVLVSAIFWGGQPRRVIELARDGQITLVTTAAVTDELYSTLGYVKFARFLEASNETPDSLIADYQKMTEMVIPVELPQGVVRDQKDHIILAAAVGGSATHVITGDKDLLTLEAYAGIHTVTPAMFLQTTGLT